MAFAQSDPPSEGFGERDSFVLSLERSFGFVDQTIGDDDNDTTISSHGTFTPLWGDIGLFGVSDNMTFGTVLGLTNLHSDDGDDDSIFRLKPRLGFTTAKDECLAAWLRFGPSMFLIHSVPEDQDSSTTHMWAASGEVYGVYTPVEHIGILGGLIVDFNLYGKDEDDEDTGYSSFGMTAGIFGEF